MTSSHHSSRQGQIVVHKTLAEMTPDEAKAWLRNIRARLVRKQAQERAYLDRRAKRRIHTPTDDMYEEDQQLEHDLLAVLDEMLAVETDEMQ